MVKKVQLAIFTFRFDQRDVHFGIPFRQIEEIHSSVIIHPLASNCPFVKGVANINGSVIPIIDTKKKFCLSDEMGCAKSSNKVITFWMDQQKLGLAVNDINEVLQVPTLQIKIDPAIIGNALPYVSGMVKLSQRIIIILNLKKLLSCSEKVILQKLI